MEKKIANHIFDKGLASQIYRELLQKKSKKETESPQPDPGAVLSPLDWPVAQWIIAVSQWCRFALSLISVGTAEKNGWERVWILAVTERSWKTITGQAWELWWRLVWDCIFLLTAKSEPSFNGAIFLPFSKLPPTLIISSLKKARKWIGEGGVWFVVLLSIIGLKTCFPTKCLLVNTLLQVHQCFYKGEQVSAVLEGTPFPQLQQDCHPLLRWDPSPTPWASLRILSHSPALASDWSSLKGLILFNFLLPPAKSGMLKCVCVCVCVCVSCQPVYRHVSESGSKSWVWKQSGILSYCFDFIHHI